MIDIIVSGSSRSFSVTFFQDPLAVRVCQAVVASTKNLEAGVGPLGCCWVGVLSMAGG